MMLSDKRKGQTICKEQSRTKRPRAEEDGITIGDGRTAIAVEICGVLGPQDEKYLMANEETRKWTDEKRRCYVIISRVAPGPADLRLTRCTQVPARHDDSYTCPRDALASPHTKQLLSDQTIQEIRELSRLQDERDYGPKLREKATLSAKSGPAIVACWPPWPRVMLTEGKCVENRECSRKAMRTCLMEKCMESHDMVAWIQETQQIDKKFLKSRTPSAAGSNLTSSTSA